MEQIYREKSSSPNVKKFSEKEIREKVAEEEEKQEEKNRENKSNSPLPPDKNQEQNTPQEKKTDSVAKIKKLKQEIEKLKAVKNKTPAQQSELSEKEKKLKDLENELKKINSTTQKPKSDNNFQIGLVISGIILLLVGLVAVAVITKHRKKKGRRK